MLVDRSVEAEAHLSFVGLGDLLAPVFEPVASSLSAPRREALEVALLLAEPGDRTPDPRAVGLALLDVIRLLAEDGVVLLALDDLQWLDASSAAVLQLALRRLHGERVGLFATWMQVSRRTSATPSYSPVPSAGLTPARGRSMLASMERRRG